MNATAVGKRERDDEAGESAEVADADEVDQAGDGDTLDDIIERYAESQSG